jgi:hypothetical protein
MIRHPLLLAVFAADLVAFLLVLGASFTAFRIALNWSPQDPSEAQLRLEGRAETAALAVGWATGLTVFATVALIYALTNLLPDVVPGAMCGTGVLQSMQGAGARILIYRLLAVALLWLWWRVAQVNRSLPEGPLVVLGARLVLLALPAMGLALHAAWQAALAMDLQQPVDCCAVIYDHFRSLDEARRTLGAGRGVWLPAFAAASIAVVATAGAAWRNPRRPRRHWLLAALVLVWLPVAAIALTRFLSAYHYGVLHHRCPWCLFLPEHHLVGFPLWGAWLLASLETPPVLVLALIAARGSSAVAATATCRAGRAARNILLALLLFIALAVGPALWWRLTFGVWLAG